MSDTPTKVRPSVPGPSRPAAEASRDEVLLGRYRVLDRRGAGGFGTVCTCWDVRLQRRVAIKRMPLAAETGTTVEEALAEARMACMLGHPNIVAVHDFEADGAYAYLVMEYVDGLNLAELLARVEGGRLTVEECAHVLSSVSRALAYAHENLALHLDIKPTNIMIDRQGVVKIADFGMSTLASAAGYGGARGGTVGYMPPEQIEGGLVDERTDLFSLAVVIWQALTGECPFAARSAEESLRRIARGPGKLSKLCPGLNAAVEQTLLTELSPSPAPRLASAEQLAAELLPFLGNEADGAASLRDLVVQAERDDAPDLEDTEKNLRPEPHAPVRVPESLIPRAATALAAFSALRLALPAVAACPEQAATPLAVGLALASAAWPPLAAPLVTLALALGMAGADPGQTPALTALAVLVALVVAAWWVAVGRHERLSSLAVLLPCCLPSPVAGAALCGYALEPGSASATAALGYLVGALFHAAAAAGFSEAALPEVLLGTFGDPSLWVLLVGSVASAAAASALASRGSVAWGVAGQGAGVSLLLGFSVLAARMENSGIWPAFDWAAVVLALLLGVLLSIATALRGPLDEGQEGEASHEFSE